MRFRVEMSNLASEQYDKFLAYIYLVLKNPQAVDSLMKDFDNTIDILTEQAERFEYCRNEHLRKLGFRKIHLRKHRYLLVYRVIHDRVIVEGMYHELQDYENAIE